MEVCGTREPGIMSHTIHVSGMAYFNIPHSVVVEIIIIIFIAHQNKDTASTKMKKINNTLIILDNRET